MAGIQGFLAADLLLRPAHRFCRIQSKVLGTSIQNTLLPVKALFKIFLLPRTLNLNFLSVWD